ncbi:MAG: HDOD domain-containing protein, partial [Betaproteobacteria bacterium]
TDLKIEEELKHHPALTLNLLRLVNSPGAGVGQKVGSIKQGIIVLGRKQLQRWLQLLLYANSSGQAGRNPLMHTVGRMRINDQGRMFCAQ